MVIQFNIKTFEKNHDLIIRLFNIIDHCMNEQPLRALILIHLTADIPRIIKKMKSQTVKIGKSVVFECMASGSPPPTFVWLKDNKKINKTARFLSTTAGQLCLIVRVEEKHAGKYTCRVSNNLGHEEQTAYLKVIEGKFFIA